MIFCTQMVDVCRPGHKYILNNLVILWMTQFTKMVQCQALQQSYFKNWDDFLKVKLYVNMCKWKPVHLHGFLKLLLSRILVCVFECVFPPRLLITSDVIWTPYDWSNKFCWFYMKTVVGIFSRYALRNEACCRNQPNKSKLALYTPLL